MSQVYQLLRLFRGVSRLIILVRSAGCSIPLNNFMVKVWFRSISAAAASSLNLAMCLSIELPVFILRAYYLSNALLTKSNIEKALTNSFLKFAYCPSLLFGFVGGGNFIFSSINCYFQVVAALLFMNDNTKVILIRSILYTLWFTSIYTFTD